MRQFVILTFFSVFLFSTGFCDIGKPSSHFASAYGKTLGQQATSTGQIGAWNYAQRGVVMAEFNPQGKARSVVYRIKGGFDETLVKELLSKNVASSGSFYKVDLPALNSLLASLPQALNNPNAPEAARKFASQLPPQALASLQQTLAGVGDLRATRDGRYIAIVDTRGQVLILEINGPSLPLIN